MFGQFSLDNYKINIMHSIEEVLSKKLYGLHYYNRIILPFQAHFLKVIVSDDIITDFSPTPKGIFIREKEDFTDVYFLEYKDLKDTLQSMKQLKWL